MSLLINSLGGRHTHKYAYHQINFKKPGACWLQVSAPGLKSIIIGIVYIATCVVHLLYMRRYEIMRSCWNFGPEDRPCFVELVQDISQQVQLMKDEETNLTPK